MAILIIAVYRIDKGLFSNDNGVVGQLYTTFTNFSMKYHLMCKVYTDVGGIK